MQKCKFNIVIKLVLADLLSWFKYNKYSIMFDSSMANENATKQV